MVQTVHYLCAHDWSASMGSAWITYFMWIKPHLLAGAQQAAAQHAAVQQAAEREAAAQRAAAELEAARVKALSATGAGGHTQVVGDVNLESVASLLERGGSERRSRPDHGLDDPESATQALTPTVHQAIYLRKLPPGPRPSPIFEGTSEIL